MRNKIEMGEMVDFMCVYIYRERDRERGGLEMMELLELV